jgi:hypothetical protein
MRKINSKIKIMLKFIHLNNNYGNTLIIYPYTKYMIKVNK